MKWTSTVGIWMLAAGLPLLAEDAERQWIHITKTERADFAPGGTIRIDDSHGDLNVEGWDRPEVEVTVNKSTLSLYTSKEADAARKRLDLIMVKLDRKSATEATISTTFPKRTLMRPFRGKSDVMLEYQIHVPRNSNLIVHQGIGAVLVTDVSGDIEAKGGTGDIVLMVPGSEGYSIDAKTKFGGVESDFGGAPVRQTFEGHQLAFAPPAPKHRIFARLTIGDITIKAMPPGRKG